MLQMQLVTTTNMCSPFLDITDKFWQQFVTIVDTNKEVCHLPRWQPEKVYTHNINKVASGLKIFEDGACLYFEE